MRCCGWMMRRLKSGAFTKPGKKTDRLVLQIGKRFLLIQFRGMQIFEIDPVKVQHKNDTLLWNPDDLPTAPLATSSWSNTDIGGAFGISAKLDADNHVIDLQLPHPPELGNLPQRSAAPERRRNY